MIIYNTEIHALGDPRYKLRRPLLITIMEYDDIPDDDPVVIAAIPEFDLYGTAISAPWALSALKAEIVSSYDSLIELGPERLGGFMLECLEAMRAVILAASGQTDTATHRREG